MDEMIGSGSGVVGVVGVGDGKVHRKPEKMIILTVELIVENDVWKVKSVTMKQLPE